jgi:hypothetical protein
MHITASKRSQDDGIGVGNRKVIEKNAAYSIA